MAALSIDTVWQTIFQAHNVLNVLSSSQSCVITSQEIKQYTNGEARLLAKFDHRASLPTIFSSYGLCLLAHTNGGYTIMAGDPFVDIPVRPNVRLKQIALPSGICSLSADALTSEMKVIDAAKASGAMDIVFGEPTNLTIRGREYCRAIQLGHNGINLAVQSVQIEVDGGFEGANSLNLIEAKKGTADSLSLRQLLYPHLHWEAVTSSLGNNGAGQAKLVRSYALFYETPIVRFVPIEITHNSVKAGSNEHHFVFGSHWNLNIGAINVGCRTINRHGAPFPQANNLATILSAFDKLQDLPDGLSKEDLFEDLNVGSAQSRNRHFDYYANALKWLGLVENHQGLRIRLTNFGKEIARMSLQRQMQEIAVSIFSDPLCHWFLHNGTAQVPTAIAQKWRITGDTIPRRRQCIEAWIAYFDKFSGLE